MFSTGSKKTSRSRRSKRVLFHNVATQSFKCQEFRIYLVSFSSLKLFCWHRKHLFTLTFRQYCANTHCVSHVTWTETRPTAAKRFIYLTKNIILLFSKKGHFYHFAFKTKKVKSSPFSTTSTVIFYTTNKYLDNSVKVFFVLHCYFHKRRFLLSISHMVINLF